MKRCSITESEVTMDIEHLIDSALSEASRVSFDDAVMIARKYNREAFEGERVIRVTPNPFTAEGPPHVFFENQNKQAAIDKKYKEVTEKDMKDRIAELEAGNNLYIDEMPATTPVPIYKEYSYENVVENKLLLKEELERKKQLIENKEPSKENTIQLEYYNNLLRSLYKDIVTLQKGEASLDAFLSTLENNLSSIETLLKEPTFDNIEAVNSYLEMLNLITDTDEFGFLGKHEVEVSQGEFVEKLMSLTELKGVDVEAYEKLAAFKNKVNLLEDERDSAVENLVRDSIEFHLKQKREYTEGTWDDVYVAQEAMRLFQAQIAEEGDTSKVYKYFQGLEKDEKNNIVKSVAYKKYADALKTNNNQAKREALSNVKKKTEKRLIELGFFTRTKLRTKKADYSAFLRKSEKTYQLIGKFSESWSDFISKRGRELNSISNILYKPNKTAAENKLIQKNFDDIKQNSDFLDITKIPEINTNSEFSEYNASFASTQESIDYKKEVIAKIGEREYRKLVDQQIQKLHSFNVFRLNREATLRTKYNLTANQNLKENISEKDWNTYLHFMYSKSPFIFSQNFNASGTNKITKTYYVDGVAKMTTTPADLEYISYFPKQDQFFDEDFKKIESDTTLNEAWGLMADLVEYNNKNGYNTKPDDLNEYTLASLRQKHTGLLSRLYNLYTEGTLKHIHKAFVSENYKDDKKADAVAGQISSVDAEIQERMERDLRGYHPNERTDELKQILYRKAKREALENQDKDLIDSILATTETTEQFKAKREVMNQMKFFANFLKANVNRPNINEIMQQFINKEFYQINNRANAKFWIGGPEGDYTVNNLVKKNLNWTKYYTENEKELRAITKGSLKSLKKIREKEVNKPDYPGKDKILAEIDKDISDFNITLESGGKVITGGSIIEGFLIRIPRALAFSINAKAQTTNVLVATTNAREVDGREGYWEAGVYHDAVSFSRKWKRLSPSKTVREDIEVGEALLNRLKVFQNSGNEIFKLEKSRAAGVVAKVAENPMNFVEQVEKMIQRPQIFALISEIKVKHKNGVDEVPMWDPKNRNFPAFEVVDGALALKKEYDTPENRATYIANTSQEYANNFGDAGRIPQAIAYINGDYRDTSSYLFEKSMVGALGMLFKRWLVETVEKKYNAINTLTEKDKGVLAASMMAGKMGTFYLLTGSLILPAMMGSGIAAWALAQGYRKARRNLEHETNFTSQAVVAYGNAQASTLGKLGRGAIESFYFSAGVAWQSIGQVLDPFTKRQLVTSDTIRKIQTKSMTNRMKKRENYSKEISLKYPSESDQQIRARVNEKFGPEVTQEDLKEIQDDLYLLGTSIATTLKVLTWKALVMLFLYPDEDEEEEHKERVNNGDNFWERTYADTDTSMYYLLENMLSGFGTDLNMMTNPDGAVRTGDILNFGKTSKLIEAAEMYLKGKETIQKGPNKGQNRVWAKALQMFTPSSLKDGVSLGFGTSSTRDFNVDETIDQFKIPILEKINSKRKEARTERKIQLEEQGDLSEKVINIMLGREFPVIKDYMIDEVTKEVKPPYQSKTPYWEKSMSQEIFDKLTK